MSRPTFRTDIPVAPLSAAQANQETLDRIRRLKANGLAEFSEPPRMPAIHPLPPLEQYPWLKYALGMMVPFLAFGLGLGRRRAAK